LLFLQFAIGQELNNPKQLIIDTFSEEQISIVRNGSRVAMTLVLASSMARAFTINVSSRQSHDAMDDEPTAAKASDPLVSNQK
jgi:hypothetical protein